MLQTHFSNLDQIFKEFTHTDFHALPSRKRFKKINKTLLQLIQETPTPCFLLPAVIDFIHKVNTEKLLSEEFTLKHFEFWLNLFGKLTPTENLEIRGKIVGRMVPRSEYQAMFPIGMNKYFSGSHFVAAHLSPDVDTTVASFIGWLDAFGCKVSEGTHQWGLPAIPPDAHLVSFLENSLGKSFFDVVMRKNAHLTMTARDLVTQKEMNKIPYSTHLSSIDHSRAGKALILVDSEGHFVGEWRSHDAESIRQIISLFSSLLHFFESNFIESTGHLLAKETLLQEDLTISNEKLLNIKIIDSSPVVESTDKHKKLLAEFLRTILTLKNGLQSTFQELLLACDTNLGSCFHLFQNHISSFLNAPIFNANGQMTNSRTDVMSHYELVMSSLEAAVQSSYKSVDRFDFQIAVRDQVLGQPSLYVTLKSDIEEMRNKIGQYDFLPVVINEEQGKLFPVGIIRASDLKKATLGTATLRDFSNLNETKLAPYLEVISIIDHHKSNITTSGAGTFVVADAQSSNTLVSELNMSINDRYRNHRMSREELQARIEKLTRDATTESNLQELSSCMHSLIAPSPRYFIDPDREYMEYLLHIFAILDDTDLLSKVSTRDLVCVKNIVNRMKRIKKTEHDFIDFSDIAESSDFLKIASTRLLQHPDLHAIYQGAYRFKEGEIEEMLIKSAQNKPSHIFADTKEQNGCCRIGQTKLFNRNFPLFLKEHNHIISSWKNQAKVISAQNPQIDLHLQMISTVPGEQEVFQGEISWTHQDEIWVYSPHTNLAREHLITLLNGFNSSEAVQNNTIEVLLIGTKKLETEQLFEHNFPKGKLSFHTSMDENEGILAIFKFRAGLINSRKAQIAPYLPKVN